MSCFFLRHSVYENSLYSDQLQFGFEKKTSCNDALFGFTYAVKYHTKRGNKVFCAFLDATKAFGEVLLNGLLAKLINRNVPLPLVRVLYNWFSGFSCSVVWNSLTGSLFRVYWECVKVEFSHLCYLLHM